MPNIEGTEVLPPPSGYPALNWPHLSYISPEQESKTGLLMTQRVHKVRVVKRWCLIRFYFTDSTYSIRILYVDIKMGLRGKSCLLVERRWQAMACVNDLWVRSRRQYLSKRMVVRWAGRFSIEPRMINHDDMDHIWRGYFQNLLKCSYGLDSG